jgi:hypothetical protein
VKFKFVCAFMALFTYLSSSNANEQSALFEAKIVIEAPENFDWSGTILEARGPRGLVFGAGFPETFTTYRHHNDATLHAFVADGNDKVELSRIDKPRSWLTGYFQGSPDRLLLANPHLSWRAAEHASGRWSLINPEVFAINLFAEFGLDQRKFNEDCGFTILVRVTHALMGNCIVAKDRYASLHKLRERLNLGEGRLRPVYLGRETLVLHQQDHTGRINAVLACRIALETLEISNCSAEQTIGREEFAYAIGAIGLKVFITLNSGRILEYDREKMKLTAQASKGHSFQLYAYARLRDREVWGQYPDGVIGEMLPTGFAPTKQQPALPQDTDALPELQSLAIYKGSLFAGIWPFGEVHATGMNTNDWRPIQRLFSGPQINNGDLEPFVTILTNNQMGQRITDMRLFGDSLYISTGNKTGATPPIPTSAEGDDMRKILPEYGQVWRVRSTGALTVPLMMFRDLKRTELRLRITADKLQIILPTGTHEASLAGRPVGCISTISTQAGTFGQLIGPKVSIDISVNRLRC